jgi:uncharacterized Fe-S cluster protein YjdI/CDGSH-type Zn-finger protein
MTTDHPGSAPAGHEPNAGDGGAGAPPHPEEANRAPSVTREYATERIAVQWRAERCIHSANCIRSLPRVFDTRRRPWVDPTAADADAIARAVLRCPTGALAFVRHDGGPAEVPDVPATLTPIRNGPLYVRGDVEIRGLDGATIRSGTRVSVCRCGLARQIPFCDDSCRKEHWREPSDVVAEAGPTGGKESAPPA